MLVFEQTGDLPGQAHTHRALGQIAEARHAWSHALYRPWHHTIEAEHLRRRLNTLGDTATNR